MNITVEIACETIQEFHSHLHELQKQIRKLVRKTKIDPVVDMFPVPDNHNGEIEALYDENCYGEHAVFITESNEVNEASPTPSLIPQGRELSEIGFGDYVTIEQKRYGVPNKMYKYKVIGRLSSNGWVEVPVQAPEKETLHDEVVDVVACICCGVCETEVRKFRLSDVKYASPKADKVEGWVRVETLDNELESLFEYCINAPEPDFTYWTENIKPLAGVKP